MTGQQLIAVARKIRAVEGIGFRAAKLKAAHLYNQVETLANTDQSTSEGRPSADN